MIKNKVISPESAQSDGKEQAVSAAEKLNKNNHQTQCDTNPSTRKLSSLCLQKPTATSTPQTLELSSANMRFESFVNANSNNQATNQYPIILKRDQFKAIFDFICGKDIKISHDQIDSLLGIGQMPKIHWLLNQNTGGHITPLKGSDYSAICCGIRNLNLSEIPHFAPSLLLESQFALSFLRFRFQLDEMMSKQRDQKEVSSLSIEEICPPSLNEHAETRMIIASTTSLLSNKKTGQQTGRRTQSTQTNSTANIAGKRSIAINTESHLSVDGLTENDTPWVPQTLKYFGQIDPEYTVKKIRGIFNKLTPANFDKLTQSVSNLPLKSVETIKKVVAMIFEKTISELTFAIIYYRFIKYLLSMESLKNTMFKGILIDSLQEEFFVNVNNAAQAKVAKLKPIIDKLKAATDPKEKRRLQMELDDMEYQFRRRAWGTVSFMGELFKTGFLNVPIICNCIENLLEDPECEDKLEFMCKLLATSGHPLETAIQQLWVVKPRFDVIFIKMRQIIENCKDGTGPKISNRVRFMIQDIIDLRARRWNQQKNETMSFPLRTVPSVSHTPPNINNRQQQGPRNSRASKPDRKRKNRQQNGC